MPRIITYSQFTKPLLRSCTSTSRSISTIVTTNIIRSRTQNLRTSNYPKYSSKMSFSNANTGDKPSDPYKKNNADDASIKEKIEDLSEFISACKFGMMTTRDGQSGALVSRCMALAGKVFYLSVSSIQMCLANIFIRKMPASISSSIQIPSLARQTI